MISINHIISKDNKIYRLILSDEYGFIHINRGNNNVYVNDKKLSVSYSHYIILNPYDAVRIENTSPNDIYILKLKEKDLVKITASMGLENLFKIDKNISSSRVFESTPYNQTILSSFAKKINDILNSQTEVFKEIQIFSWSAIFFTELYKLRYSDESGYRRSKLNLRDIDLYCLDNISNPNLSLNLIADYFQVTSAYLTKFYKKQTGYNLMDTIIRLRLTMALEYLRKGQTVSQVYSQVGFNTYSNFFVQFKKVYGMPPSKYLNLITKK